MLIAVMVSDCGETLQVYGEHQASDRMVSGAYKSEYGDADEIGKVMQTVEVCLLSRLHYVFSCILIMHL